MNKSFDQEIPSLVAERHALFAPLLSRSLNFSGFSNNGAAHASSGQRPGAACPRDPALKGWPNGWFATSGLGWLCGIETMARPSAGLDSPFGAQEEGVGYGG
jgi:hypothetical protein